MERGLTRAFYTILGIFLACLLPSFVMIYIINFCDHCDCIFIHWMRDLQFLFPLVNCWLNQFLYAWKIRNFRRAISAVLCKTVSYEVSTPQIVNTNGIIADDSNTVDEMELIPLDPGSLRMTAIAEIGETNQIMF